MRIKRGMLVIWSCMLLLAAQVAAASGAIGVYGIVERVVFEPDAGAPERVRVYGAFVLYDARAARIGEAATQPKTVAESGFLYFALPYPDEAHAAARREWADLAAVAGSGEAVAFAEYFYSGAFTPARRAAATVLVKLPTAEHLPEDQANVERLGGSSSGLVGLEVWPESSPTPAAVRYRTAGTGVVRLGEGNHADVVAELRAQLGR